MAAILLNVGDEKFLRQARDKDRSILAWQLHVKETSITSALIAAPHIRSKCRIGVITRLTASQPVGTFMCIEFSKYLRFIEFLMLCPDNPIWTT